MEHVLDLSSTGGCSHEGRPAAASAGRRAGRWAALAAIVGLAVSGCGGAVPESKARPGTPSPSSSVVAKQASVEQLASVLGCKAEIDSGAADYRKGTCRSAQAQILFISFDTDKGQRDWLDYAQMYGGIYLVGNRWVISAKPKEYMETIRAELGGTIETTGAFGATASPSPGAATP